MKIIKILIVQLIVANVATSQVLDKVVLLEPLKDNAIELKLNNDKQCLMVRLHLLKSLKGHPNIIMTSLNPAELRNVFMNEIIESKKINNKDSVIVEFSLKYESLLSTTSIDKLELDFKNPMLTLHQGDWTPLNFNKNYIFCVCKDNSNNVSHLFSIVYSELPQGQLLYTREIDGVLQTEKTVNK